MITDADLCAEVERLRSELCMAKTFYDLVVKERDYERARNARLESSLARSIRSGSDRALGVAADAQFTGAVRSEQEDAS